MFYSSLSQQSLYHPETEKNPARTRWKHLRRRIFDGTFFLFSHDPQFMLDEDSGISPRGRRKSATDDIDFFQVISNAKGSLNDESSQQKPMNGQATLRVDNEPQRLAHGHSARAAHDIKSPSSFESYVNRDARKRMSAFIDKNGQAIRRLSVLPSDVSLADAFNRYADSQQPRLQPEGPSNIAPPNMVYPESPVLPQMPARKQFEQPNVEHHQNPSLASQKESYPLQRGERDNIDTKSIVSTQSPLLVNTEGLNVRKTHLPRNSLAVTSRMRPSSRASNDSSASISSRRTKAKQVSAPASANVLALPMR